MLAPAPPPFTPRAKKVLQLAVHEARSLHHGFVGAEHILLGLVRECEGVAADILTERGAPAWRVRRAVSEELSRGEAPTWTYGMSSGSRRVEHGSP